METKKPDTLGERIVSARKKKGLLQKELAEKIGISPTALNYYEKNKRKPNIYLICDIAYELGVTIEYILGHERYIDSDLANMISEPIQSIGSKYFYGHILATVIAKSNSARLLEDGNTIVPIIQNDQNISIDKLPLTTLPVVRKVNNGTATQKEIDEVYAVFKYIIEKNIPDDLIQKTFYKIIREETDYTPKLKQLFDQLKKATPEEIDVISKMVEVIASNNKNS